MVFEIAGKVAVITGGATGIGLCHAKELLRQNLRGVTIADIDEISGKKALKEIEEEFGTDKAIYVKTDVSSKDDFENALKKTVEHFEYIDILINNAGILEDGLWEKEISINITGTTIGTLLGLENYLKNYKQGSEAVILNTSSTSGMFGQPLLPVYSATKSAIAGLTKTWGHPFHYKRTNVRTVCLCPGGTNTILLDFERRLLLPEYIGVVPLQEELHISVQEPEFVAKEASRIIKYAETGTVWIVENSEPAFEYKFPTRENLKQYKLEEK